MATLTIGDKSITIDDGFLKLSPQQQNDTVAEIAKSIGATAPQAAPEMGNAFTDILPEARNEAQANIDAIKGMYGGTAQNGILQQQLNVGKGLLAIPAYLASPFTGAIKSLVGHPMADLEHKVGEKIAPEIAAQDNPQEMYDTAKGDVGTALMGMRPYGATPVGIRAAPPKAPASADLVQAYKDVVNSPAVKNAVIPPQEVSTMAAKAQNDLIQKGFRPTPKSAPDTFTELNRLTPGQGVQSVSIDDLLAARRALGKTALERNEVGAATPDAVAARHVMNEVDDIIEAYAPDMIEANANYAAAKAADLLDYRNARAARRAARSGSGMNIENTMRQEVDKIPDRGLTPAERAARDQIVMGTAARNALRIGGKLGVGDGLTLGLHAGAAYGTGGASLPLTAAGTTARIIGESLTRREISNLSNAIRSRSPLAKSTPAGLMPPPPLQTSVLSAGSAMSPASTALPLVTGQDDAGSPQASDDGLKRFLEIAAAPSGPPTKINARLAQWNQGNRAENISRIANDPRGRKILERLATLPANDPTAQMLAYRLTFL